MIDSPQHTKLTQDLEKLSTLYRLKAYGYEYLEDDVLAKLFDTQNSQNQLSLKVPEDYDGLKDFVHNCTLCEFSKSKKHTIFGSDYHGKSTNQPIKIMFVGDFAGAIEDESGDIFAGKSSQTLINMITKVLNLDLKEIYYTNILKCRPPINKTPNADEVSTCIKYLHTQIKIIKPLLIVALGEFSFAHLDSQNLDFKQIRGNKIKYNFEDIEIDMVATFHPGFFTRNPSAKKDAMQDLAIIKSIINTKAN